MLDSNIVGCDTLASTVLASGLAAAQCLQAWLGGKGVMTANGQSQNLDCDLLVIGGGAAGLSGAVTAAYHGLKVIVAEKASVLGGATSWSGGWMWVPLNPLSQADGIVEDIDCAPHLSETRAR